MQENQQINNIMTKQEENWELLLTLGMPWHIANDIEDRSDRDFLLEKCGTLRAEHEAQMRAQQQDGGGLPGAPSP